MRIPVISVVGWHNVGKTTLIERLVVALKARGLRVGTVKHSGGHISMDREGTDTWRFRRAGSDFVGIASSRQAVLQAWPQEDVTLWHLLDHLPEDLDLLIVEGYKRIPIPKVVVTGGGTATERNALENLAETVITVERQAPSHEQGEPPRGTEVDIEKLIITLIKQGYIPESAFA